MIRALLFDLGDTLVGYYRRHEFPSILNACLGQTEAYLRKRNLPVPPAQEIERRAQSENFEARNLRVRPLEQRLKRIFSLRLPSARKYLMQEMCRAFLAPIFSMATLYPDTLPALASLKKNGLKIGILSNTPWGSPADLWHGEVARHGLCAFCDKVIFCRDVGWRKPARSIFRHALQRLACLPESCVFVGDNLKWDIEGGRRVGMVPVLIDRSDSVEPVDAPRITSLLELESLLKTL